jgi:hypothetical protein
MRGAAGSRFIDLLRESERDAGQIRLTGALCAGKKNCIAETREGACGAVFTPLLTMYAGIAGCGGGL